MMRNGTLTMTEQCWTATITKIDGGVVVTSVTQPVRPDGKRNSAKFINPTYLVRDNGTEYN